MRVALVAPFVAAIDERAPQLGGAQSVVLDLARGLASRGHHVTLVAPRGSQVRGVQIVDLGLAAEPRAAVGADAEPASQIPVFAAVGEWLAARTFDIVHSHAFDAPAFERIRGPMVVHTLHLPPADGGMVAIVRATEATIATVSDSCRAAWEAAGVSIGAILPNGIDVAAVPLGAGDSGYLAFAGRMSPEKDPVAACRVARAIGWRLRLAGPLYDERYFAREVQPYLGPDAAYLGALDRDSLWRMLGAAAATLLPVRWDEPFGMVALESLAAGTPVVAYARGGLPEVITHGRSGLLVAPGDESALSDAARRAPGLRRGDCRADAERHGLDAMLDAHEALYRRVR